jgi:hypothetical protein
MNEKKKLKTQLSQINLLPLLKNTAKVGCTSEKLK